jgi:flagellar motor protein MotB
MLDQKLLVAVSDLFNCKDGKVQQALYGTISFLMKETFNHLEHSQVPSEVIELIHSVPDLDVANQAPSELLTRSVDNPIIRKIHSLILGESSVNVEKTIAQFLGSSLTESNAFLSFSSALLFGKMKAYLQDRSLNAPSLKHWLGEQIGELTSYELPELNSLLPRAQSSDIITQKVTRDDNAVPKKKGKYIFWFIIFAALAALAFLFTIRSCKPVEKSEIKPLAKITEISRSVWGDLGAFFRKVLPDGKVLTIPQHGVESRLLNFIESDRPVNGVSWFTFDRLRFKTNSVVLEPESQEQLNNIVQILKSYPSVRIKLGGYTDTTGTDEHNLKLSEDRATSVRQSLIDLGADGHKIEAQGYGSAYPIADNDTPEHRAINRRIDILVLQK